jgi:alpha-ketoglutarate-dependent 2,4-dichlorophenoxyacetate dioxygenase
MWDNRQTMHRGRRYDRNEVRDLRRTTLAGDVATIEQAAAVGEQAAEETAASAE